MASFEITAPDGTKHAVDAPEGATQDQALEYFKANWQPTQKGGAPEENALIQGARGFSARGNQALAALNPWADKEKVAAEQQWVNQHPAAQIGSAAADVAMSLPVGGLATAPARALATGAISASTQPGDLAERLRNFGYGTLGAGVGESAAKVLGAAIQPFKPLADEVRQALISKAKAMGIPLDAADITGNKSLEYARSALENLPSSAGMQQAQKEAKQRAWERAIFTKGGETADRPTESVMADMKDRISDVYNSVNARNELQVDSQFKDELQQIANRQLSRIPTNQRSIVESYLNDFSTAPEGATISGNEYQDIRSMLDRQAKAFKNTDPATHQVLKDIRKSADNAMDRSVSVDDAMLRKEANKDWMVMKNIEGAINAQGATDSHINPALFANALRRNEANAMVYGQGPQDMADFAKVGKQFIQDPTRDSGTAQRQMMIAALKGAPLVAAGEEYSRTGGDIVSTAAPLALAYGLPKLASKMIQNPSGYLSEGLADMTRGNREKILADVLRNAAIASNADDKF